MKVRKKKVEGLGIIDGKCLKIKSKKITKPHNGWNNIKFDKKSSLFVDFDLNLIFTLIIVTIAIK